MISVKLMHDLDHNSIEGKLQQYNYTPESFGDIIRPFLKQVSGKHDQLAIPS